MPSGSWTALLLLLLLLLPAGLQAQSGDGDGDGDSDQEPRISCSSHIMTDVSSLTCKLLRGGSGNEDDEDEDADSIEKMTMCYTDDWRTKAVKCLEDLGDTVSSRDLSPLLHFNVTVHLRSGGTITKTVDLKKIVKPRRPQVWNVTFSQASNQAVIHIWTPYHKQYLSVDKLRFQLLIWTADRTMIQNISASDKMKIEMKQLQKNSEYHVKVRAIPLNSFQGSWSEWSETFSVFTPAGESFTVSPGRTDESPEMYALVVVLLSVVLLTAFVLYFGKNKIFTYMWPSIPDPKHTLVQICKPNKVSMQVRGRGVIPRPKDRSFISVLETTNTGDTLFQQGLLLSFKPEVFSALKVYPVEKREEQPCDGADGAQHHVCSTQSSSCSRSTTSVSTEELELSALLSRSSSDGEDRLQSTGPSLQPGERPRSPQPDEAEVFGGNQQEEAYVTMSSFYQIK